MKGKARVMVVVKRAETLVPALYAQSESLGNPLNGKVAELLQFMLVHRALFF